MSNGRSKTKKTYCPNCGICISTRTSNVPNKAGYLLADGSMDRTSRRPSYRICRRDRFQSLEKQR